MLRAFVIAILSATPLAAQDFFTLKGHGGPIMDIAVSRSDQIATASFDNAVGIWSGTKPRWLDAHAAAVNTVQFVDNVRAVSGGDDFALVLWDLATGDANRLVGHEGRVTAIDVSSDMIASASWDGSIGLWPLASLAPVFLKGHDQGVNAVAFSKDESTLFSASIDGSIRVWDVAAASEKHQLVKQGFGINKLILNETEGWIAYGTVDGVTRLIDIESGALIADFSLDRRPILAMAYHAGTQQLAVGDGEGIIMMIDTADKKITRDFRATKRGPIWALAFSTNGQNIHAGGIEDILYSWPIATMDKHGQMANETRSFLENPALLPNGERQFKRKCSICHALSPSSARKAGPTLHKLFGRPAGTVTDYSYSDILTETDIVWSDDTIDALFKEGPDHYIPGTKMPMQRIAKEQDRADLIDYLRQATVGELGD